METTSRLRKVVAIAAALTLSGALLGAGPALGQGPSKDPAKGPPGKQARGADTVVFNAKIVTVDNDDFTDDLGTVAEAMAIKDGKITAIGTNRQVRRQVGRLRGTQVWDMQGRTIIPGMTSVHEHPYDWGPVTPRILEHVLSDDDVVTRVLDGSPDENQANFEDTLAEAVSAAEPGQWIYIVLSFGDQYQYTPGGNGGYGPPNESILDGEHEPLTFDSLTELAPDNPVLVRDVFVGKQVNQLAWEEAQAVFPVGDDPDADFANGPRGIRWYFPDVVMRDKYELLREIQRLSVSYWAGYGFTSFGSHAYTPSNIPVFEDLIETDELDMRNQWSWWWRNSKHFDDEFFTTALASRQGQGGDMFWFGGAQGSNRPGSTCTILDPETTCAWTPGSENEQLLYDWIRVGGRFTTTHTVGDRDLDYAIDVIERASADAGITLEEIREQRHTFDHNVMNPRPDQIPRMQHLGMATGGAASEIWEACPDIRELYPEAEGWVVPKRSLMDAEIPNAFEIDRTTPSTDLTAFWYLSLFTTRNAWDGSVCAPDEAISRELALKTATTWGAYYLKKEDVLGSLEVGKYADFAVLDRDYLTIPEDDIKNVKVLMTVMDGKPRHVTEAFGAQIGEEAVGAQAELGVVIPDEVGPPGS